MNTLIKCLVPLPLVAGGMFAFKLGQQADPTGPLLVPPPRGKTLGMAYNPLPRSANTERLASLTPEEAASLMAKFSARTPDISQRSIYAARVIGQLCENGYTGEAWEMIDPNYGNVRRSQLTTFFIQAKLTDDELLAKLPHMDLHGDRSSCFSGYTMRFPPQDLGRMLASPAFANLIESLGSEARSLNVSSAISCRLQMAIAEDSEGDPAGLFGIAAELNSRGLLDANDLMIVAASKEIGDSFAKWEILEGASSPSGWSRDAEAKRDDLISGMVREDGSRAMTEILSSKGPGRLDDLDKGLAAWTRIDPAGAFNWYHSHGGKLNRGERDQIAKTFASEATRFLEFEGARRWAAEITDEALQAGMMKQIDEKSAEAANATPSP